MRRTVLTLFFAAVFILAGNYAAKAQLELPALSPAAKVEQRVGLTDITIEYSSPGVRGREIWGALVPYNEVWRMGANASTKVTFSRDVKIGGKELKAGTYSVGAIPGKDQWTVIFSPRQDLGGWGDYNPETDDALRVNVKPEKAEFRERLHFIVSDFDTESARIDMEWAGLRVPVRVDLGTNEGAMANIDKTLNPTSNNYAAAARYVLDMGKKEDLGKALTWINKSIELNQTWYNTWIKARILAEQNNYKDAYKTAQKAHELGLKAEYFFWKDEVEQALKDWQPKAK